MGCFGKSLAGAGYIVLNAIRVLNIVSLLAVIAASTVMLVKTFVVSKFYFFDATAHVIEVVISGRISCSKEERMTNISQSFSSLPSFHCSKPTLPEIGRFTAPSTALSCLASP